MGEPPNKSPSPLLRLLSCCVQAAMSDNDARTPERPSSGNDPVPSDPAASASAHQLLARLHAQVPRGVLFGHQDTAAYGVGWSGDIDRSDIKDICGRWPAVYGWDIGLLHKGDKNVDGVSIADIRRWIIEADGRGGINTLSLHEDNPETDQNAWDTTPAVANVLQSGTRAHGNFCRVLDSIAEFLLSLRRADGSLVPVVLRPFHEHNEKWAWWGAEACSDDQYKQLWRLSINYLRGKAVHNALYAYCMQDTCERDEFMSAYPGNEYVDVLGLDYYKVWDPEQRENFGKALSMMNREAIERRKVAALTEVGVNGIPDSEWWTEFLLNGINYDDWSRRTVWALLWRNMSEEHHFGPYLGHPSVPNFLKFFDDEGIDFGPNR